jgi:hypothetical protein
MNIEHLKINLIYSSPLGSYAFNDNRFTLYQDDNTESEFINCIGGIEFITNRHFIFLQLVQYDELLRFVDFLIRSLIDENTDDSIKSYFLYDEYKEAYSNSLCVLKFDTNEKIELNYSDNNFIRLSFSNESSLVSPHAAEDKYFSDFLVPRNEWIKAANIALKDYFKVVNRLIEESSNSPLRKMQHYWEEMVSFHIT